MERHQQRVKDEMEHAHWLWERANNHGMRVEPIATNRNPFVGVLRDLLSVKRVVTNSNRNL